MTITLESIAQQISELSAKVDAISSGTAAAKPAATIAGDTLPGSVTVTVRAPESNVRYKVALNQDGKAVEVVVPEGWTGTQGFTCTYNENDPSGRSAQVAFQLLNPQGASVIPGWGAFQMVGPYSFCGVGSNEPPWHPRVPAGRYMLTIRANTQTLLDFEFH